MIPKALTNNGDWAKVTDSYGTIGWIETQYLSCSDMGSEASDSDELDLDDLDLTLE
jgi:SH3-like domain-containing protein